MAEPIGGALWQTPKAWALRRSRKGCPICRRGPPRDIVAPLPPPWVTAPGRAPLPGYVVVERANPTDRLDIERLIAAYLASEGVKPRPERITWAVEQVMKNRGGGLILVGREKKTVVGVALAVYSPSAELGRLLIVNDFFVDPGWRRKGVGRALATRLLEEAKAMRVERIDLEVTPTNATAATFWKSMGFRTGGRTVYGRDIL